MLCGWIFTNIIGNRRSTKVAKIMIIQWHLTFLRWGQFCFCMHLYGKNIQNFKWLSLEPLGQFCSKFIWNLFRLGEWKIAKMVVVCWPRWLPCPHMVKTFKNLLLQNGGCLGAESLLRSLETVGGGGGSTKVAKIMVLHWHLTFLRQGQVCFPMHLYGKKHLKIFFSKTKDALWLNLCIYHWDWAVYQSC